MVKDRCGTSCHSKACRLAHAAHDTGRVRRVTGHGALRRACAVLFVATVADGVPETAAGQGVPRHSTPDSAVQARVDTPYRAIPGLRMKASVRQDTLNPRLLWGALQLVNSTSTRIDVAYGACFLTFRAYRRKRDRRAMWTYRTERYPCPMLLYLRTLEPGERHALETTALLDRIMDDDSRLTPGCFYFTLEADLRRPRIHTAELPAGRTCLR